MICPIMKNGRNSYIGWGLLSGILCILAAFSTGHAQEPDSLTMMRQNLGPNVNTKSIEILPLVSPDGGTLYFDRKYDAANVGGEDDEDDIYYSTLQPDSSWSTATNIGAPFNTTGSDVLFWISPDGNTALIHSGRMIRTTRKQTRIIKGKSQVVEEPVEQKVGLAIVRRRQGVWQEPKPLKIDGLEDLGIGYYACISPDTRKLLVAFSQDSTNNENLDIYYCSALSSDLIHWSEPVNLGSAINTTAFEGAPFIAADNRTLYFASAGHAGFGQSDLFMSRRVGDSWLNWTKPVNLGPGINTPLFEASISVPARGDYIYMSGSGFSMQEVSYGRSDIYRLQIPHELQPLRTSVVTGVLLGGSAPLEGLIRVERTSDQVEIFSTVSDADGRFTLVLPLDGEYRVIGWTDGFKEGSIQIRTTQSIQNNVTLKLIPEGGSPIKGNLLEWPPVIYFATGSDDLSERARSLLKRWLPRLNLGSGSDVKILGHTDNVGEESQNLDLSIRRAERVGRWLVDHGVDAARIMTSGRGELAPVAPNDTAKGRAANRRVEISLSTSDG